MKFLFELRRLLTAMLVALILLSSTSTTAFAITREQAINEIVALVNIERKKAGLRPLKLSRELLRPAAIRAREITKLFSHTRPNGMSFDTAFYGIIYKTVGENIAAGQTSSEMVMQQWMDSPGHRANILNKKYKYIGVAYLYDENTRYKHFWVQHFKG
ncbi:MAG: hypothetical protein IJ563_13540 [Selenomonadaceae bacterium]|nr:hypothetical protein [Selenomonadaceae bacterium]